MTSYFFIFFISIAALASEELMLQQSCSKSDLEACEKLTAYYLKSQKWENAATLGEALCSSNRIKGCSLSGMAFLARGKTKEGVRLLSKACDGFKPNSCHFLSRLMRKIKMTF